MDKKFQLLYDYLSETGNLQEGSTADSFKERYLSGESDIEELYNVVSSMETPFDVGGFDTFSDDFFGVKKKEQTVSDQNGSQVDPLPSESPLGEVSTESTSVSDQDQEIQFGGSDYSSSDEAQGAQPE